MIQTKGGGVVDQGAEEAEELAAPLQVGALEDALRQGDRATREELHHRALSGSAIRTMMIKVRRNAFHLRRDVLMTAS